MTLRLGLYIMLNATLLHLMHRKMEWLFTLERSAPCTAFTLLLQLTGREDSRSAWKLHDKLKLEFKGTGLSVQTMNMRLNIWFLILFCYDFIKPGTEWTHQIVDFFMLLLPRLLHLVFLWMRGEVVFCRLSNRHITYPQGTTLFG